MNVLANALTWNFYLIRLTPFRIPPGVALKKCSVHDVWNTAISLRPSLSIGNLTLSQNSAGTFLTVRQSAGALGRNSKGWYPKKSVIPSAVVHANEGK